MHLLTVLLLFATCNHVLLQPLLKPPKQIPKTWHPTVLPSRNLNISTKTFHDNFYNKTVIPWIHAILPELQGPCFSCLYFITPAMLQHRMGVTNVFDKPEFLPHKLIVTSKKNLETVNYFDIGTSDMADPYPGFVIPKAKCRHENIRHLGMPAYPTWTAIANVEIENADPSYPIQKTFNMYHDDTNNKLCYFYKFPEMVANMFRTVPMRQYQLEDFMKIRGQKSVYPDTYLNLKGGDFTIKYSITKAVKGEENCEVLFSLGSATKPIIAEETLNQLPNGNENKLYPKNFHVHFYSPDAYGNLQANRRPEFEGWRLKPNYIHIPLVPFAEKYGEKHISFQFFEHPNPVYGATYTLTTVRACCVEFYMSFFNDHPMWMQFCDENVVIDGQAFHMQPDYVYSENYWHVKRNASAFIKYRFFIPPISSDDVDSNYYPKTPQRIWAGSYNFVLYIIKEPTFNNDPRGQDHEKRALYFHKKIKLRPKRGVPPQDPTNGGLVTIDIKHFKESCLKKKISYKEKETIYLEIEGPGILLKKPVNPKKDPIKMPTPTMRPQIGRYDVTRRVTEGEPTFEPRTDPTYTERTTTMKTSSASMPMGIIIGIMIALMIIILLWVYFADILCKKKSATNELLILEPPPRAATPLPQSIEEVPPEIRLSADEPVSRPKKKPNVEKKEPEPPPIEKKRIPIPTPAPPHPGREASSEEPIPNTNGSLLSSIQKPMPDVLPPMPILPPPTPAPQPPRTNFITCYEGILYSFGERILTLSSAQSIWDVLPFTGGPDVPVDGYYFRIFDLTTSIGDAYKNFNFRLNDKIDMQDVPNWEVRRGVKIYILENDPAAFEIHTSGFEPPYWIPKIGGCQPCLKLSQNDDVPTVFTKSEVPKMNETIKALPTCWHMYSNYVSSDKANPDADDVTGVYVFRSTTDMVLSPAPKSCYHLHTVELKPLTGKALANWKEKLEDRIVSKVEKNVRVPEPSEVSLKYQNMSSSTSSSKKTKTNTEKTEKTEKSVKTFKKPVPSLLDKQRAIKAKLHTETAKDSKKPKTEDATKTETEDSTKKTKTEAEEGSIKTEDETQATPGATPPNDDKEPAIPPLQGDSDRTIKPGGTAEVFAKPLSKKLTKKPATGGVKSAKKSDKKLMK